jgi:hypothetical protein
MEGGVCEHARVLRNHAPNWRTRLGISAKTASVVVGTALVLAGCSASPPNAPAVTTSTTTSTTAPPPSTTTTAEAAPPCTTSDVTVTSSTGQGAAGTLVQRFLVTNSGSAACSMNGEPFISPDGPLPQDGGTVTADLPLTVSPIPAGFGDLGGAGGQVTVAAGQAAVFFLKWSDVVSSTAPCYTATGFDFRTPQAPSTDSRLLTFSFSGGICGGTLYVSQILPASVTS